MDSFSSMRAALLAVYSYTQGNQDKVHDVTFVGLPDAPDAVRQSPLEMCTTFLARTSLAGRSQPCKAVFTDAHAARTRVVPVWRCVFISDPDSL